MTVKILKGETWSKMAKSLGAQMNEVGAKMIWADVMQMRRYYALAEMQNPEQIKTFGERPDIVATEGRGC